jgi:hypothetical protein
VCVCVCIIYIYICIYVYAGVSAVMRAVASDERGALSHAANGSEVEVVLVLATGKRLSARFKASD